MDFEPIRWVTVHPSLVHFPLGLLPLAALAYVLAAVRQSKRWTFVGDVALVTGTLGLAGAAIFGGVSWVMLDWPGGLDPWRWVHLGAGAAVAVLALIVMIARLVGARKTPIAGGGMAVGTVAVAALVLFTGWIGGEVLVYQGGMAVQAAGDGALAPSDESNAPAPDNLEEAMAQLRGAWGSATTTMAHSIVAHPTPAQFTTIARDARTMQRLGRWVTQHGAEGVEDPDEAEDMRRMAGHFTEHAADLEQAAASGELSQVAARIGVIQADCAGCHEHTRWEQDEERENGEHVASRR